MPDPISASEDGMGGITASPAAAARIRELYAEKLRAEQERDNLRYERDRLLPEHERAERAEAALSEALDLLEAKRRSPAAEIVDPPVEAFLRAHGRLDG